jgi:hypothetical protein
MKKIFKKVVLPIALLLSLSACIGGKDLSTTTETLRPDGTLITTTTNVNNSDTHSWAQAYKSHVEQDQAKKVGMAKAISREGSCENCTDEGKAWSEAFKVMAIAYGHNFQSDEFTLERPTNGYDLGKVAIEGLVDLGKVATFTYGGVELGKALVNGAGSSIQMGDEGHVESSFNTSNIEAHATAGSGDPVTTMGEVELEEDVLMEEINYGSR